MSFNSWKLAGNKQMDRRFMYIFYIKKNPIGLSAKFIGIYPRSRVSVYRTIGVIIQLPALKP